MPPFQQTRDSRGKRNYLPTLCLVLLASGLAPLAGCRTAPGHRLETDRNAQAILHEEQKKAFGHTEPFSIERPVDTLRRRLILAQDLSHAGPAGLGSDRLLPLRHWPEQNYPAYSTDTSAPPVMIPADTNLTIDLLLALQIGVANNRDYQTQKESVYQAALNLDLERAQFGGIFEGLAEGDYADDRSADPATRSVKGSASIGWSRRLKTGATLGAQIALDLVQLLTGGREYARGLWADTSITLPLLRGAGWEVLSEPVTLAERKVVYALWTFELFKQHYAVQVATEYLTVLQYLDQAKNAEDNYRGLIASGRRARRLADAGRLPEVQVNQAMQDELRARERWLLARASYAGRLDSFKTTLGLPPDAKLDLDPAELRRLADTINLAPPEQARTDSTQPAAFPSADTPIQLSEPNPNQAGPYEMGEPRAIALAFTNRLDLCIALGSVFDAQRQVIVAANGLLPDLTLTATAQFGARRDASSAASGDSRLQAAQGIYNAALPLQMPWNRTTERIAYRTSFIALEAAIRAAQALEDQVKLAVRADLRGLTQARESVTIQRQAVDLARRRVASTELFLQAGRTEIRDLLEAQEALISAQNNLAAALVNYRVTELQLQSDMGVLEVDSKGLWREYQTNEPP